MGNGFAGGRFSRRGLRGGMGMGFGFRGSSPPWPYVGIGRGGLPRHAYSFGRLQSSPYPISAQAVSEYPYPSELAPEQELDSLRNRAQSIGKQLEQIDNRIVEMEKEK
jgi:hypothetical protein